MTEGVAMKNKIKRFLSVLALAMISAHAQQFMEV